MKRHYLWGLTALSVVALSGCASLSADGGLDQVSQLTRERIAQPVAFQRDAAQTEIAQARVSELLKGPLSVDSAVEVALLSNRDLQAQLANLGIAEADLVRAGRLRNPGFSFGRLSGNGVVEYDRTVMFDLLGLLTMPMARQIEQQRFERAQLQAAQDAVTLAANTRRAYFNAVGAQEQLRYLQQVKETADIANELAKRMAADHTQRFLGDDWQRGPENLPIFDCATSVLIGKVRDVLNIENNAVVICDVVSGALGTEDEALLYYQRAYRATGNTLA